LSELPGKIIVTIHKKAGVMQSEGFFGYNHLAPIPDRFSRGIQNAYIHFIRPLALAQRPKRQRQGGMQKWYGAQQGPCFPPPIHSSSLQ